MKAGDIVRVCIDFALEDWIFSEEESAIPAGCGVLEDVDPNNRETLGMGVVCEMVRPEAPDWEWLADVHWFGGGRRTKFIRNFLEVVGES